ncbi:DUF3560 domain-containing protein [Oscillospiraceae bacterium OttesenSCG-928-F05]|nr:DUF3560 domain-containing protein [Oscillospiraceae bacterium OttesenSCG-928-F05]
MNDYEAKKQARIDRYRARAEKASKESDAQFKKSQDITRDIPPGQPILVGHYSEKRHRRDIDRSWNALGKSVEASEKAAYYEQKAEAAESNTAISSDDPEALSKLKEKLAGLEARHREIKAVNAYYRKHGTMRGYPGLSDEAAAERDEDIKNNHNQPYPHYTLPYSNANIKRIKNRIASLERARDEGFVGWKFEGGEVVANAEENRLQIFFDEKPDEEKRKAMKSNGFHYSKYNNHAWQRQLNRNAIFAASYLEFVRPESGIDPRKLQPYYNRSAQKDAPER